MPETPIRKQKMQKFRAKTIPSRAHPIVQAVFEEMNEQKITYAELSDRSGVNVKVFERWRLAVSPQLGTIESVLKALNLELKVGRKA